MSNNVDRSINGNRYDMQGNDAIIQTSHQHNQIQTIRMPRWFPYYEKQYNFFPLKLRSFTFGKPMQVKNVLAVMNSDYLL